VRGFRGRRKTREWGELVILYINRIKLDREIRGRGPLSVFSIALALIFSEKLVVK